MRRLLYAFLIIAFLILVAFLGYYFRYREAPPDAGTPTGGAGYLPGAPSGGGITPGESSGSDVAGTQGGAGGGFGLLDDQSMRIVSDIPILDFRVLPDSSILAAQPEGQIIKIISGDTEVLSASPIPGMLRAEFSADGKMALVASQLEMSNDEKFAVFDIESKTWQPLPSIVRSASWGPDGQNLIYLADGLGGVLNIVTIDLSKAKSVPQTILSFPAQDIMVRWSVPEKIFISEKSSARVKGSYWSYDIKKKLLSNIISDASGIMATWNASGTVGLVFTAGINTARGGSLSLVDGTGKKIENITFLTLPTKCSFETMLATTTVENASSSQPTEKHFLLCALPRGGSALNLLQLPDEYYKWSLYTSDDIYRVDMASGAVDPLLVGSDQNIDLARPAVSANSLYFINRFNKRLYALTLPRL